MKGKPKVVSSCIHSDELRKEILEKGYEVKDTPQGQKVLKC